MADNNFTQLQEEENVDESTLDHMQMGIMSNIETSRSMASFFEFLINKRLLSLLI